MNLRLICVLCIATFTLSLPTLGAERKGSESPTGGYLDRLTDKVLDQYERELAAKGSREPWIRVQDGDTLQRISQKIYGSTRRWKELRDLNRGAFDHHNNLRVGVRLRYNANGALPHYQYADPGFDGGSRAPQQVTIVNRKPVRERRTCLRSAVYARPGETLQDISKRVYGTTWRWGELYRINQDRLKRPEDVRPGMMLRCNASIPLPKRTGKKEFQKYLEDDGGGGDDDEIAISEGTVNQFRH